MSELTLMQKYPNLSVGSEILRHQTSFQFLPKLIKTLTDDSASDK